MPSQYSLVMTVLCGMQIWALWIRCITEMSHPSEFEWFARPVYPAMLEDREPSVGRCRRWNFCVSDRHFRPVLPVDGARSVIAIAEDVEGTIWAELAGPSPRLVRIDDFQVA